MPKFEYKVEEFDLVTNQLETWLNSVGEDGWELVQILPLAGNYFRYVFQREAE